MQQLGGIVVKLDRGFPLVRCDDGSLVRCEHAASLEKNAQVRAVIGDSVRVNLPDGHDKGVIEDIDERRTSFVRRDPAERTAHQVLAANFDLAGAGVGASDRRPGGGGPHEGRFGKR